LLARYPERSYALNADSESTTIAQASVAAILVNWRQPHRTIEAARALALQTVRVTVVVVDNCSGDDSVDVLRAALPGILIVAKDSNGGFGAGCNAGIEYAVSMNMDYVWLINNDAIPEQRCLEHLLARAINDPSVGVVGALIREPSGTIADHAGCVMSLITLHCRYTMSEADMAANRYAWITGASMLLSMRALQEIGTFDVGYFMYWEDADICHRLRQAGFTIAIASDAVVEHLAGTSSNQMKLQRYQWHIKSQVRWINKHYIFKPYGVMVVYMRHLVKSILTLDWSRFQMSLKVFINKI
jgi:GT2 family glycosyltransferase